MKYTKIVEIIKEVTGLHQVPVYFHDHYANSKGTPYFGLGNHAFEICPEEYFDDPMFVIEDFIGYQHYLFQ